MVNKLVINKSYRLSKKEILHLVLFILLFLGIILSTVTFIQYIETNNNQEQQDNNNEWEEKKQNGKSGKHQNTKAKEVAKDKWLKAKDRLNELKQQKRTKEIAKQIRKVENEIKHWLKKMNESGETHWRKGI